MQHDAHDRHVMTTDATTRPRGTAFTPSRRAIVTGALAGAALVTLGAPGGADADPAPSSSAPTTEAGWLDVLAAHRDTVSLRITTVDGLTVSHRAGDVQQSASAIKVFHLAAYAQAVAAGTLSPDQTMPIRAWERWYYPADGGAHAKALKRLGIPTRGNATVAVAADPNATVRLDDVVSAMIRESDNAAADVVRELVGPQVLRRVVAGLGAVHTVTPTLLGANLRATHEALAGEDGERVAARYVSDRAFTTSMLDATSWSGYAAQAAFFTTQGPRTSAADLSRVYRGVSEGTIVGVDTMRRHLEWAAGSARVRTGFKGGSLPGVLTAGIEQRVPGTGRHASAALLIGGLDERTAGSTNTDWVKILIDAMSDDAFARQVAQRLSGPTPAAAPLGPKVQTDHVG